jgi:hypothetical protein
MERRALHLFSGFTYVGSGPARYSDGNSVDTAYIVPHGTSSQDLPSRLREGTQYVFHPLSSVNDERLALEEFPRRLSSYGFKVVEAPKSTSDLLYLVVGGLLFTIKFADGAHEAIIFNQLHTVGADGWSGEDYVLVYTR